MKRNVLLIFIVTFLNHIYSQDKKINFELAVGPTISLPKTSKLSNIDASGSPEIESSFNIGAFILPSLSYSINNKSSFDFGIGFYLDRFSIVDKIGIVINEGNRNISQIITPVNYNFSFTKDKSYQLGIGGFASFLIAANESGETRTDFSESNIFTPISSSGDSVFVNNSVVNYDKNIEENYNKISFGAFIQLKKFFSFSSNRKGFILFRINQYINSIINDESNSEEINNEKEPTTLNLGFGILF